MEEKEIPKPGYFTGKPYLESIRQIKKLIGSQDSCLQTNQVAILYLEEQAKESKNVENFINELCEKYKISHGTNNMEYFKKTLYKSYILQTYNLVEPSLKKLNKQYKYFNNFEGTWKTKEGDRNLDPFNQLVNNLDSTSRNNIKSYPEYYLLDYYRLIRNSIVHLQEDENEHTKTLQYYKDNIIDKLKYFQETYEMNSPNEPNEISFEDFMLYTRAIKYFVNILNNICFPEIKTLVKVAAKDEKIQKKLYSCRHVETKGILGVRINTLHSYFQGHFGNHNKLGREFCREYLSFENINYDGYLK